MFAAAHVSIEILNQYRCIGAKRGLCKRTGQRHLVFAGTNDKGEWLTAVAEPYPRGLCTVLAQYFRNFELQQLAEAVWKRLNQ